MANRFEPSLEGLENLILIEVGELLPETLQVPEGVFVDETDEAEEF
jgi:hypothetical protein